MPSRVAVAKWIWILACKQASTHIINSLAYTHKSVNFICCCRCHFTLFISRLYLFICYFFRQTKNIFAFFPKLHHCPDTALWITFSQPLQPGTIMSTGTGHAKTDKRAKPLTNCSRKLCSLLLIFNSSPVSASRWFPAFNLRFTFSHPSVKAGRNFYFQQSDIWRLNLSFEQLFVVNTAYGWIYVHKYVCIYVNLYLHTNKLCNEEVGGGHGPAAQVQRQTYLELSWNLHTYIISINVFFEGFQINILANVNLLVIQVNVIKLRRAGRSVHFFATFFLFNIHTYANYSHLHTQM